MKRPRWGWFEVARFVLSALLIVALPAAVNAARLDADGAQHFDRAQFVLSDAAEPPGDSAAWQPVTLPDQRQVVPPETRGEGWYRFTVDLAAPPRDLQALYLPTFGYDGQAFVNGRLVGQTGTLERPQSLRAPHLFSVSPDLLRAGRNTVHIRLRWNSQLPARIGLMQFGAQATLLPRQQARQWQVITGFQLLATVSATLGIFMLLLWGRRREEAALGWFGLCALSYTLYLGPSLFVRVPLAPELMNTISQLGGALVDVSIILFALRYAGWRWPRAEWALWGLVPLYQVAGLWWEPAVDEFIVIAVASIWVVIFAIVAWRRRTGESVALALASACWPLAELWRSSFAAPGAFVGEDYSFLLLFLVMGWILVNRFARSLDESEQLNAELAQRVEAKRVELEQNYRRLHALEQQQAVAAERQRIMSDMHDGIGGQLITTLSLVENGKAASHEVAAALRDCIDDLRLAIDSLEPTDDDLLPVLGNLRYRIEARLKQQGIALDWKVEDVPRLAGLTPQNVLHILRILQEAFTNIVKHAGANRIQVETGVQPARDRMFIRVRDNGRGFSHARPEGRGLTNMLRRARLIGGDLHVLPTDQGTTLELWLPVGGG